MSPLLTVLETLGRVPGLDVTLYLRAGRDVELVVTGPVPVPDEARAKVPSPARMLLPRTIQLDPTTIRATVSSSPRALTLTTLDVRLANGAARSAYRLVGGTPFVLRRLAAAITKDDPACRVHWAAGEGALPLTLSWD